MNKQPEDKPAWRSRTIWLGAITFAVSLASAIATFVFESEFIKEHAPEVASIAGTIVGILVIVLRFISKIPVRPPGGVIKPPVVLLAIGAALLCADTADACGRCGLFGRRCRFVSHKFHAQKAVVVAQQPQTVILQSNNYAQPLGQLGNTGYGYTQGAYNPYQYIDRQAALNSLARMSENLVKGGVQAAAEFRAALDSAGGADAAVAAIHARGHATTAALSAAGGANAFRSPTQTITVEIDATGQARILGADKQTPLPAPGSNQQQPGGTVIQPPQQQVQQLGMSVCLQCHSGAAEKGGGLSLEDLSDSTKILRALDQVKQDRMPPKAAFPDDAARDRIREQVVNELFSTFREGR